jgi:hypothetical protein
MELWLTITRSGAISRGLLLDEIGEHVEVSDWDRELEIDSTVMKIYGVVCTETIESDKKGGKNSYMLQSFELDENGDMVLTGTPFFHEGNWTKSKIQKSMRTGAGKPTPIADKAQETPAPVEAAPQNADALSQLIAQNQQMLNMIAKQQQS